MARPTTSAVSMAGAMISKRTRMAERAKSIVSAGVMASFSKKSDRHVHDLLVGGDHLVAHRHHRIESEFGGIHRIDHIDDIGLAGNLGGGGLLALLDGADRILDRAGEEVREIASRHIRGCDRG